MSDWTPTTQQVRDGYRYDPEYDYYNPLHESANVELRGLAFDRWLEQVKAEARDDALADAGLLARPLPTRDEIAEKLRGLPIGYGHHQTRVDTDEARGMADAVLALLKGQQQ